MATETLYHLITSDLDKNLLIQNNYLTGGIIFSYIMFTKVVGPSMMKNKKPLDLQLLMILYNAILVASNVYISARVITLAVELWPHRCDVKNTPVYKDQKKFHAMAWGCFLVKFSELFDTVFFILRKKFQQASFLHIFHHAIVCLLFWICLRQRLIGYYLFLIGSINCPIHVLLYSYYALSALGPGLRKYLWWKKYLTTLQIMQFLVLMAYMGYAFLTGCEEFGYFEKTVFVGLTIITVLFLNFYYRTYGIKKMS